MPRGKPVSTDVVPAQSTAVVSVEELMKQQIAEQTQRIQLSAGNKITVDKTKTFTFPDGHVTSPGQPIEVVVLDFVSFNVYYDRPWQPGVYNPPACFAMGLDTNDRLVPDETSPDIQSDACLGCPQNEFETRGAGKACQNRKNLAVLPPDADEEADILMLSLSPTAIRAWDSYVGSLASVLGRSPVGVITTVGFDPKSDYATLRFGKPVPLETDRVAFFMTRLKEARDLLMIKPDTSSYEPPKAVSKRR